MTESLLTPAQMSEHYTLGQIAVACLCPVCGKAYTTVREALACSTHNEQPVAKPGDIVIIDQGYTWFDGDPAWVVDDKGYEFHGKKTLRFWFVITDVTQKAPRRLFHGDRDAHRVRYHVQTLAIKNGMDEGRRGWTCIGTHIGFVKPDRDPPASVVKAARGMVGRRFDNLL